MSDSPRANVLLITCDCLRGDHVGCCRSGEGPSLTPNLDALAAEGTTFGRAIAQGFRTPISMPSLFTGKYPSRLRWFRVPSPFALRREVRGVLIGDTPTITDILRRHGYQTAGFHSNPLLTRLFGFDRGFGEFFDDLFLEDTGLPRAVKRWAGRLPLLVRGASHLPAPAINAKATAWLGARREPFFLWLHYMDTHGPYRTQQGAAYLRKVRAQLLYQRAVSKPATITDHERASLVEAYRNEVRYLDHHLGQLFDAMHRMGCLDNTLVVVTADHGEEFGEHGRFNHHSTLYEELLHVPLIVRLPRGARDRRVVSEPVGLTQVVPTILDVLGIVEPLETDGRSLLPVIEKQTREGLHDWLISEARAMPGYKACIRQGPWKLIVDAAKQRQELYRLDVDPSERLNLIADEAETGRRLEAQMVRVLAGLGRPGDPTDELGARAGADVLARLRDLGYL